MTSHLNKPETVQFYYVNSAKACFPIELAIRNQVNLMEIIRDRAYEDWGDCRGRAWCRTCHVSVNGSATDKANHRPGFQSDILKDEEVALRQLEDRTSTSRLACQLYVSQDLNGITITHIGDC